MHRAPRAWPLWPAGVLVALAAPCLSSEPASPDGAADGPASPRPLAWVLNPGEVRGYGVQLDLETKVTVTRGGESTLRQTSTVASFEVESLGLRRRRADEYVIECRVQDLHLAVLTTANGSAIEVAMDNGGLTVRERGERGHTVPWGDVPRGRGGEIGELLGRAMTCTVNRLGIAAAVDDRMAPWQRVLDSMDLTPLLLPMVPVPDADVEPGMTWTVTGRREVHLSRPWGTLELETRTEVKVLAIEQRDGRSVARLGFVAATKPAKPQVRLDYAMTVRGEVVLGLDGAVVDGEADVTVTASAAVVDAVHQLVGAGTLHFPGPSDAGTPLQ